METYEGTIEVSHSDLVEIGKRLLPENAVEYSIAKDSDIDGVGVGYCNFKNGWSANLIAVPSEMLWDGTIIGGWWNIDLIDGWGEWVDQLDRIDTDWLLGEHRFELRAPLTDEHDVCYNITIIEKGE